MPDIVGPRTAPPKPAQINPPLGKTAARSFVDRMMVVTGVSIACASVGFAAYMTANADHPPPIAGLEYLAIFARPSHSAIAASQPSTPVATQAASAAPSVEIDPTPTGSIIDRVAAGQPANLILTPARDSVVKLSPPSYKILSVANGEAVIDSASAIRRVKVGAILPDLGRVNAIEKRGDHWVVLTQSGAPLEWVGASPSTTRATPPRSNSPSH